MRSSSPSSRSAAAICCESQPRSAVTPSCSAAAAPVQQLREVAQVGQPPLAVRRREHAGGKVLADHDRLGQLGDAPLAKDPGPAVKPAMHALPLLLGGGGDPRRAPADERRQGGRPRPGGGGGPVDRLEQPQPVTRGGGREHAARAVDDRRDARRVERRRGSGRPGRGCGRAPRCRPRTDRVATERGPVGSALLDLGVRGEQRDDVGGEILRDVLADRRRAQQTAAGALDRRLVAVHDADAQRRADPAPRAAAAAGGRVPRGPAGRRSPGGRAARRRTARRRRPAATGRCGG